MMDLRFLVTVGLMVLGGSACEKKANNVSSVEPPGKKIEGMVWIPGGTFMMGTDEDDSYVHERPAHLVKVSGFWMDETEVTNAQFQKFIEATGYRTIAERKPDWSDIQKQSPPGTPKPPDSLMVAGALMFNPPKEPVMLNDYTQWWRWVPGTDWKHPEGPDSNLNGRMNLHGS
jgi:formylglycine-generating enzyme required for sulfatase activity